MRYTAFGSSASAFNYNTFTYNPWTHHCLFAITTCPLLFCGAQQTLALCSSLKCKAIGRNEAKNPKLFSSRWIISRIDALQPHICRQEAAAARGAVTWHKTRIVRNRRRLFCVERYRVILRSNICSARRIPSAAKGAAGVQPAPPVQLTSCSRKITSTRSDNSLFAFIVVTALRKRPRQAIRTCGSSKI